MGFQHSGSFAGETPFTEPKRVTPGAVGGITSFFVPAALVGRLSPALAPESTPCTRGLLKSALSLAAFLGLGGLPLRSKARVILEQPELAPGDRAALQVKPSGWWEEPGECASGTCFCCQ